MINWRQPYQTMLLAGLLASSISISCALGQAAEGKHKVGESQPPVSPTLKVVPLSVLSQLQSEYYRRRWGIDDIVVRETASGSLIRLSFIVIDAVHSRILNVKHINPLIIET